MAINEHAFGEALMVGGSDLGNYAGTIYKAKVDAANRAQRNGLMIAQMKARQDMHNQDMSQRKDIADQRAKHDAAVLSAQKSHWDSQSKIDQQNADSARIRAKAEANRLSKTAGSNQDKQTVKNAKYTLSQQQKKMTELNRQMDKLQKHNLSAPPGEIVQLQDRIDQLKASMNDTMAIMAKHGGPKIPVDTSTLPVDPGTGNTGPAFYSGEKQPGELVPPTSTPSAPAAPQSAAKPPAAPQIKTIPMSQVPAGATKKYDSQGNMYVPMNNQWVKVDQSG